MTIEEIVLRRRRSCCTKVSSIYIPSAYSIQSSAAYGRAHLRQRLRHTAAVMSFELKVDALVSEDREQLELGFD